MGPCPPKPSGSKFINEEYQIYKRSVKVVRTVEYGPVPAEAVREEIHKGKHMHV